MDVYAILSTFTNLFGQPHGLVLAQPYMIGDGMPASWFLRPFVDSGWGKGYLWYYCHLLSSFIMPGCYLLDHGQSRAEMTFVPRETGDYYAFLKGELSLPSPLYFKQHQGAVLYDHVVGGDPAIRIYHRRFFDALASRGITGFSSVPAILQGRKTTNAYECLVVTGRAGEELLREGKIIDRGPIMPGGPSKIVKRGVFFDHWAWDGSDFFLLQDRQHVIITERVRDIILELQLTNVKLVPLEEVEVSIFTLTLRNPVLKQYYLEQLGV